MHIMLYCKTQNEHIFKRITQARKDNSLKYEIVDIDMSSGRTYAERMQLIDAKIPGTSQRLHHVLCEHYRKSVPLVWYMFLKTWIPRCTNFIVCYTSRDIMPELYVDNDDDTTCEKISFICAVGMYTRHASYMYGRMLCSRCFVGMKIIEHLKEKYARSQYAYMTFHVSKDLVALYEKHGAIMTNTTYTDIFGATYHFMYLPFTQQHLLPFHSNGTQDNCSHYIFNTVDIWCMTLLISMILTTFIGVYQYMMM